MAVYKPLILLKSRCEPAALADCTLGVELGCDVGSANQVRLPTGGEQGFGERAQGFLARTYHHVIDGQDVFLTCHPNPEAGVVHAQVFHRGQAGDAFGL